MAKVFERILIPTDFGAPARNALDLAARLATEFDSELVLLHCWEFPTYAYSEMTNPPQDFIVAVEQAAREELDKTLAAVQKEVPRARSLLRTGVPWQEILAVVEELHADLVVMGTQGRRGIKHVLLGSVAEKVVRLSPVPVLTVHGNPAAVD